MATINHLIEQVIGTNDCSCVYQYQCFYCRSIKEGKYWTDKFVFGLVRYSNNLPGNLHLVIDFQTPIEHAMVIENRCFRRVVFSFRYRSDNLDLVHSKMIDVINKFDNKKVDFFCERLEQEDMKFFFNRFISPVTDSVQRAISILLQKVYISRKYFDSMIASLPNGISDIIYPNIIEHLDERGYIKVDQILKATDNCLASVICSPRVLVKYCADRNFQMRVLLQCMSIDITGWKIKEYGCSLGYFKELFRLGLAIEEIHQSTLPIIETAKLLATV